MLAIRKIWDLLIPSEHKEVLVLLLLMAVGMIFETVGVGLVIPVVALMMQDDLAARYPSATFVLTWLDNPSPKALISGAMIGLVGVYLLKNLFLAYSAWWQIRFTSSVHVRLSQRLFTIYLRQPYVFHLQRNSAQLFRNVTSEVGIFVGVLTNNLVLLTEGFVLLGIAALLLVAEPLGALVVGAGLGTAAWIFHVTTRHHILRWGELRMLHAGLSTQHLMQGLGSAKDVKLIGCEKEFLRQFHFHNAEGARVNRYQTTLQALPRMWLELLAVSGLATLVLTMLAQGKPATGIVPTLGLFAAAAFRLMPSVNRILNSFQILRFSLPVNDAIFQEFELAAPEPPARVIHAPAFANDIALEGVTYTYPGGVSPILHDLSLVIQRNQSVGFVGPSGSGKSTLIDVILGLFAPDAGQVKVDGKDIQGKLRAWQDQIGYVPQTIYLTDDTLRRNVAFGLSDDQIDDAAVWTALQAAQLTEFVEKSPDGLDTMVGERGVRLSGGQRQRIGIARALYHDPTVLVLDEATSALDVGTERDVMQAVMALHGTKTLLIVAHRLSTVERCDKLYHLEHGRIVKEESTDATA